MVAGEGLWQGFSTFWRLPLGTAVDPFFRIKVS